MDDNTFRDLLDLMMESDEVPEHLAEFADDEAQDRGYDDWIEAYNEM